MYLKFENPIGFKTKPAVETETSQNEKATDLKSGIKKKSRKPIHHGNIKKKPFLFFLVSIDRLTVI